MTAMIASTRRDLPRSKGYRRYAESYILDVKPCCPEAELADGYLRISMEKQQETEQEGIPRQMEITLERAHATNRCIRRFYVDDDVSASKPRLVRAAFTQLLHDLKTSQRNQRAFIYVQHQDRFYRLMKDLVSVGEINDTWRPIDLVTNQRTYVFDNDDDYMILELSATMGRRETRATSRRVKDARRTNALNGRLSGGPRRFGWDATPDAYHALALALEAVRRESSEAFDWLTRNSILKAFQAAEGRPEIVPLIEDYKLARQRVIREGKIKVSPIEAELIRDAHRRLIEGSTTVNFLTKEWTLRGIRGAQGGVFEYVSLVRMLTSVTLAGYRTFKDEPVVDAEGNWVRGPQEAIVSREELLRVLAVVQSPPSTVRFDESGERKRLVGPRSNIKRLLSGLTRCGSCGGPMFFSDMRKQQARKTATVAGTYRCFAKSGLCPKSVTVTAAPLEQGVLALVGKRLAQVETQPAPVAQAVGPWERQAELDRLIQARNFWSDQMDDPEEDMAYAAGQVRERNTKITALVNERRAWERQLMQDLRPPALVNPGRLAELQEELASGSAETFGAMTHLRLLLEEVVEAIVVKPLERRVGPKFDYSRVVVVWREDVVPGG